MRGNFFGLKGDPSNSLKSNQGRCQNLEHRVRILRGGRHRLQHIPVLDDLAIGIEAEDIYACGLLTK
jgi:hypothetical protein